MSAKLKIIFVVLGSLIGLLTTAQLISDVQGSGTFPYDQIQSRKKLLATLSNEQLSYQTSIQNLRDKIDGLITENSLNEQEGKIAELETTKASVGLTVVRDSGLEIILSDGQSTLNNIANKDDYLVHAGDLRDLVNAFRAADAKAISINDQRIISSSAIVSVGNSILINNVNVSQPFLIQVAGDAEILERKLSEKQILIDLRKRINDGKINIQTQLKKFLNIPSYNGSFRTKFIGQ